MTKDKEGSSMSTVQENVALKCVQLTDSNYTHWAILMETILKAYCLWEPIGSTEKVDEKKAHTTKAMIFQTLPGDILMQVAQYESAKEVWDAIKVLYLGADLVQKARLQTLRSEFETLKMKENETISDFSGRLGSIRARFKNLGSTLKDKTIVRKLLNSVPKKFLPIVATIEQYSEIDTMLFEEAIGRITAFEERIKSTDEPEEYDPSKLLKQESKTLVVQILRGTNLRGTILRGSNLRGKTFVVLTCVVLTCVVRSSKQKENLCGTSMTKDKEGSSMSTVQENVALKCVQLTDSNYTHWAILMETILKAYCLWEPIGSTEKVDEKKAHTTKAMIFQTLPGDILMQVAQYESAKEVWDAIKVLYLGADLVQKARLQTLRSEFETLKMKENETISDFSGRLGSIRARFKNLGSTLKDKTIVRKLLNSVPKKFLPIVATIEQYSEIDTMPFEEAVGRITAFEERIKSTDEPEEYDPSKLLLATSNLHLMSR
ncbi:zinc finger, CCHC-type [Artemisia annua]|uniref:Zinc finger, CCHC-type n=1 Tax=Artemisia annua TaxID=35608 RepID=A0A2U1L4J4_ARTAN|nr:zinc finger, CCHC-type [Artemisia annua]